MTSNWKGRSKGTVLGYRIFVFFIRKFGLKKAYFLLYFVSVYYLFFSPTSSKAIYYYLRHRQRFSVIKSVFKVYASYVGFGKTLIDKIAISSGLRNKFTYTFDGIDQLKTLLEKKQGGLLISAHVGNFEIAWFFLNELDEDPKISLLTTDAEHRAIKNYLESVIDKPNINLILIKEDLSHIFKINEALSKNELICLTGDRFNMDSKILSTPFLNKPAPFPAGPFTIGSRLNVPVVFVYVMKETNSHYHLYARSAIVIRRNSQDLLEKYVKSVEWILGKYPLQWFNYYDFWDTRKKFLQ